MAHVTLKTVGMHCMSCAKLIEMNVGDLEGVTGVGVNLASGITEVDYDPGQIDVQSIVDEIVASGYGVDQLG